jgi:hypothetical protein
VATGGFANATTVVATSTRSIGRLATGAQKGPSWISSAR